MTTIPISRGAYTHRIVDTPEGPATVCGIDDPMVVQQDVPSAVDCPYCTGRRSKWEGKAAS